MRVRRHIFSVMFYSSCGAECSSSAKFCGQCGHQINEAVEQTSKKAANSVDVQELTTEYFHRRYPQNAIVGLLEKLDGVGIHARTLKRKLKELG